MRRLTLGKVMLVIGLSAGLLSTQVAAGCTSPKPDGTASAPASAAVPAPAPTAVAAKCGNEQDLGNAVPLCVTVEHVQAVFGAEYEYYNTTAISGGRKYEYRSAKGPDVTVEIQLGAAARSTWDTFRSTNSKGETLKDVSNALISPDGLQIVMCTCGDSAAKTQRTLKATISYIRPDRPTLTRADDQKPVDRQKLRAIAQKGLEVLTAV